jgi:hypothetical protein
MSKVTHTQLVIIADVLSKHMPKNKNLRNKVFWNVLNKLTNTEDHKFLLQTPDIYGYKGDVFGLMNLDQNDPAIVFIMSLVEAEYESKKSAKQSVDDSVDDSDSDSDDEPFKPRPRPIHKSKPTEESDSDDEPFKPRPRPIHKSKPRSIHKDTESSSGL